IVRILGGPDSVLRYLALNALYRIVGHSTQSATLVPLLMAAFKDDSACVRHGVLDVLRKIRKALPADLVCSTFTAEIRTALRGIAERDANAAVRFGAESLLESVEELGSRTDDP